MYRLSKILCKYFYNYRQVHSRATQKIILTNLLTHRSNTRLCWPKMYFPKPNLNRTFPANIAVALSILTWLGFTEDDENKESELIMTLKRAVLCTQREEYGKAEQMLHLALRLAQQQQNEQGVIYCYDLMANLAFDQQELNKAEKLFVSVLQLLLSKGMAEDDLKVIHISLKLARICQLRAEIEKAEIGYRWCLDKIENKKNNSVDSQVLYGVINDWYAQFLLDKGDVKKALIHLKEAYQVSKKTRGKDDEKSVLLLNDLGITSLRAEDMSGAEKYLNEAVNIGEHLDDKYHLGVVYANLGLILLEKGLVDEANRWCRKAYRLGKNTENPETVEHANYCFDQIKLNLGK